jgi:large subunit ribosomal protein L13
MTEYEPKKNVTINAKGRILGKLAVEIADTIRGKNLPSFSPNKDPKINVEVINFDQFKIIPKKLEKKYFSHSGYIGNLKTTTFKELLAKNPKIIIQKAVAGMLPKNRLKKIFLSRICFTKETDEKK